MKFLNFFSILIAFLFFSPATAQPKDLAQEFWDSYSEFKESSITHKRFKHEDVVPLIKKLGQNNNFDVQKVGESIEGRDLFLISVGTGEIDVFLWSQMHGDESTATMAVMDIFNFITSNKFSAEKNELFKKLRLHFLPMLNPDGAEVFQRRNALGIDINRDALRLQSPEGKTLKRVRDSLNADFGFNLHDQSKYYNAEGTANPATISFLAPAYNYEKDVNEVRGNAMKVIIEMNEVIQRFAPGQVAKYNDDFEPRAFGDNIQKWGTSAILIESGGFLNDPGKQEIRKLNFVSILSAVFSIANEDYKKRELSEYEKIPENDSKLYDLKLTGLEYELAGDSYILDLGINYQEIWDVKKGIFNRAGITDQGDLSTNYGYNTHDLTGYKVKWGKVYPNAIAWLADLSDLNFKELLTNGYSYVKIKDVPESANFTNQPVIVVGENFKVPSRLGVGVNPTFFLEKDGKIKYAIVNGFFHDLENLEFSSTNGLILK
ncbi:peptidase M14 [Antarcticibacterium arcticum]|uniref:Peptidase M14 n=1 Tax=Antarcticibacterium arcticum TaxID=2585771 RepID=A0A5B8YQF1_9FLAO|nr:M14 family zinc carboxypeptidase [Antarcticibacterium arcticum]QED38913.1 peptidase M14 [Antarcticibacterium arcticum]